MKKTKILALISAAVFALSAASCDDGKNTADNKKSSGSSGVSEGIANIYPGQRDKNGNTVLEAVSKKNGSYDCSLFTFTADESVWSEAASNGSDVMHSVKLTCNDEEGDILYIIGEYVDTRNNEVGTLTEYVNAEYEEFAAMGCSETWDEEIDVDGHKGRLVSGDAVVNSSQSMRMITIDVVKGDLHLRIAYSGDKAAIDHREKQLRDLAATISFV